MPEEPSESSAPDSSETPAEGSRTEPSRSETSGAMPSAGEMPSAAEMPSAGETPSLEVPNVKPAEETTGALRSDSGVAQRDEPPAETQDETPAEAQGDEALAVAQTDEAPPEAQRDETPAEAQRDETPAEAQGDETPAEAQGDEPPAETQDETPAEAQGDEALAVAQTDEAPPEAQGDEVLAEARRDEAPSEARTDAAFSETELTGAQPRATPLWLQAIRRYWRPLSVFAIALALRLFYNLLVLDFRVCNQGDAGNLLDTAAGLMGWLSQGGGIGALLAGEHAARSGAELMRSSVLSDRLLADGPVFPAYLAVVGLLCQMNPDASDFASNCTPFAIANSIVDSVACVLLYYAGRLAFDRGTALLAAILLALYAPAVINTQSCFSEPFAYFLLTGWTCLLFTACLRHLGSERRRVAVWASLGALTALVVLVKPAFAVLPPVIFAVLAALRIPKQIKPAHILSLLAGAAVLLAPWLWFTSATTGSPNFFVNGLTALDLSTGNSTETDGWATLPPDSAAPSTVPAALAVVGQTAAAHPLEFLGLQLRKIPRLWGGGWNDNRYSLPFLDAYDQDSVHDLLLFCAVLGAALVVSVPGRRRLSRSACAGVVLIAISLFHFFYCIFDPVSRDNITAMPSITLLAAYAFVHLARGEPRPRWWFAIGLVGAALLMRLLAGGSSLYAYLADVVAKDLAFLIPFLDGMFWIGAWFVIWRMILPTVAVNRRIARPATAYRCLAAMFGLAAAVTMACCLDDPERKEWWTDLKNPGQIVRQDIYVPPLAAMQSLGQQALVILDLESPVQLPRLALAVNGERVEQLPLTWLQVESGNRSLLESLAARGRAMGRDIRSFRQWWVMPIPLSMLRFGASNTIMIKNEATEWGVPTRIYGDYSAYGLGSGEVPRVMPSLDRMSIQKGFETSDPRDPRIYEVVRVLGKETGAHWFGRKQWSSTDLSENPGRQVGEFRIRLGLVEARTVRGEIEAGPAGLAKPDSGVPPPEAAPFIPQSVAYVSGPQTVAGWNEMSMMLATGRLPPNTPSGALFFFSCELKDFGPYGSAAVTVQFVGEENGKPVTWTSIWQPSRIALNESWIPFSFADIIPDRILRLENLRVMIMVTPFHEDRHAMRRGQALGDAAEIKNASLLVLPPLQIPAARQRLWMFF